LVTQQEPPGGVIASGFFPEQTKLQSVFIPEYIAANTEGETDAINIAMTAPVSAAVAQTFALALVSAPIICPDA